ncbi:MAG: branched-chain amino acid transport system ATP-binding protein [Thermosediminibacterales bacterium]|nr:branched-chain amino acid transport system ATP-binding protein [Thermosediminibacterales bacterium]MDK2836538.1 branched-chain amino acid transport system ATP-binding protein [Thermosediminibacterales bacterium]
MILQVKGLTKYFGGLAAVKNVDFTIEKGEILGLIGPNGAGKTTIFNLITGFIPASDGKIIFKDEDITRVSPPYKICRKGIGRTFQVVKPFANMTVLETVMAGAFCREASAKLAREKALQVLDFVDLYKKKDFLGKNLTIGDRKRLELAKALATEPELLLLDEVMAGLTPTEINEVLKIIAKIQENGITIFIIEHIMKVIMTLSHRIIVLHHGEKIAEGAPEEVAKDKKVIEAYLGEESNIA